MFTGLFSNTAGSLSIQTAMMCTAVSLLMGLLVSVVYRVKHRGTDTFITALIILPALVQMAIMMVNGNLGMGVAVAGIFGLVRFRSVPGTAQDIVYVFLVMTVGLASGTGYLGFAVFIGVISSLVLLLIKLTNFSSSANVQRELRVTIPEALDYTTVFDDIFEKYTKSAELEKVKTTNLGSMFELKYRILLKDIGKEKEMIDEIRVRNGNLTIICSRRATEEAVL